MFGVGWTLKELFEQVLYHMWFKFMQVLHLYRQKQWSWAAENSWTYLQRCCFSRKDGESNWLRQILGIFNLIGIGNYN